MKIIDRFKKLGIRSKVVIFLTLIFAVTVGIVWAATWTSYPDQATIDTADTFLFYDQDDATPAKVNEITWGQILTLLETWLEGLSPTITGTYDLSGGDIVLPAGSVDAGTYAAASIDGDDINSNIAGRSLTLASGSPDVMNADAELYTETQCIYIEDPTDADDLKSIWYTPIAVTLTQIWAESDQTVTFMLQVDDGSPADVDSVDLAPAAGVASDTSLNGDATMGAGDRLDIDLVSTSGTPTWVSICWTYTKDD